MVHRDIKPGNLFLSASSDADNSGQVKILDLGLARRNQQRDAAIVSTTGQVVGTSDYMAPEQTTGASVDVRTDTYALGATLYKLLTGVSPFPAEKYETPMQMLIGLVQNDPIPIQNVRKELPDDLAAIIHKMLAKSPDDRFETANEVIAALANFDNRVVSEKHVSKQSRISTLNSSNRQTLIRLVPWFMFVLVAFGAIIQFKTASGIWALSDIEEGHQVVLRKNGQVVKQLTVSSNNNEITAHLGEYSVSVVADGVEVQNGVVKFQWMGETNGFVYICESRGGGLKHGPATFRDGYPSKRKPFFMIRRHGLSSWQKCIVARPNFK